MLPLLNFLHVVPGRVLEFFQKYIVADKKNVLNILISCPEKNVRVSLKIIIAACISIMLKYDSSHARNGEMQPAEQNVILERVPFTLRGGLLASFPAASSNCSLRSD